MLFRAKEERLREAFPQYLLGRKVSLMLSLLNLFIFLLFLVHGYLFTIHPGKGVWAKGYGLNVMSIAVIILLLFLLIMELYHEKTKKMRIHYEKDFLNLCLFGFLISFFLHFLLFDNFIKSWEYLLMDFKVIFLRHRIYSIQSATMYEQTGFLESLGHKAMSNVLELTLFLITFIPVLYLIVRKDHFKGKQTIAYLMMFLVTVLNFFFATRNLFRDLLLVQVILLVSAFVFWGYLNNSWMTVRIRRHLPLFMGLILLVSFSLNRQVANKFHFVITTFGYSPIYWISNRYYDNHLKYREALYEGRFKPSFLARSSMHLLQRYPYLKTTLKTVFSNRVPDLKNIGFVEKGHPIRTDDLHTTIQEYSPDLKGGLLVDLKNSSFKKRYFVDHSSFAKHTAAAYRPSDFITFDSHYISIFPKGDKVIFLFVRADLFERLMKKHPSLTKTGLIIKTSQGISYKGAWVRAYGLLSRADLGDHYFSVIIYDYNPVTIIPKERPPYFM
jgi:hypothetical protein